MGEQIPDLPDQPKVAIEPLWNEPHQVSHVRPRREGAQRPPVRVEYTRDKVALDERLREQAREGLVEKTRSYENAGQVGLSIEGRVERIHPRRQLLRREHLGLSHGEPPFSADILDATRHLDGSPAKAGPPSSARTDLASRRESPRPSEV